MKNIDYYNHSVQSGYYDIVFKKNKGIQSAWHHIKFNYIKKKISNLTKSKYCGSTTSGTSAIQIALLASGVKPYDEVLVPSLTFVGTANAISHCGAIPHFIDSEIANFGVDVEKLRDYLKKNFKIQKRF